MVDIARVEMMNYHDDVGKEAENIVLIKLSLASFMKIFAEITLGVKFLD